MVILHRNFLPFLFEKVKLLVNHYYDHDEFHSIHKYSRSYMPNTTWFSIRIWKTDEPDLIILMTTQNGSFSDCHRKANEIFDGTLNYDSKKNFSIEKKDQNTLQKHEIDSDKNYRLHSMQQKGLDYCSIICLIFRWFSYSLFAKIILNFFEYNYRLPFANSYSNPIKILISLCTNRYRHLSKMLIKCIYNS